MKALFYCGLALLTLFEIMNVYFIMPMPGSQRMDSIEVAYFLYSYRWAFRITFALMITIGGFSAFQTRKKWIPALATIPLLAIIYLFNFKMTADHMFLQPDTLVFSGRAENVLPDSSLVIAVTYQSSAKAYPIRYILYHHQVRDTISGKPVMVTYCNVCRTGRVFEPLVNGKPEHFRLVGMDHFNAMFEDATTGSWWRQATGEAIAGPLKGEVLPGIESHQYTLGTFFSLHPFGAVMQAEAQSMPYYDTLGRFESGRTQSALTRTDSLSWKDKSWVVGVEIKGRSKAYDWNDLKERRVINDRIGATPIVVAIASDDHSFIVLERDDSETFAIRNDSLAGPVNQFDFAGRSRSGGNAKVVSAHQEFWHSWKQFHPETEVYR